jgi:SAM-dependent methyltransferase
MWYLTLHDRLYTSPVPQDVQRILDVGTGSGSWAIEIARAFPRAAITGTDVTPPTMAESENLTFMESNAEKQWPFPPNHFDFIHGRMLVGAILDWPSFLERCYAHLTPGGMLELPETCYPWDSALAAEGVTPINSPFLRWSSLAGQAWARAGFDNFHVLRHEYRLTRLGFVDLEHDETRWPVGPWAIDERQRNIGTLCLRIYSMFMKTIGVKILTMNGFVETEEAELLTAAAIKDVEENHMDKKYFIPV